MGFVHFVPAPATGDLSLSAMRRLHNTPNGLMEFLLCETFAWAGGRGIERISLNFNAFGDLLRSDAKLPAWERGLRFVLARADRFFQVERLLAFNRKFFPSGSRATRRSSATPTCPGRARTALDREPRGLAARLDAPVAARLAGADGAAGRRPRHLRASAERLRPTAVVRLRRWLILHPLATAPPPASREQLASVLDGV